MKKTLKTSTDLRAELITARAAESAALDEARGYDEKIGLYTDLETAAELADFAELADLAAAAELAADESTAEKIRDLTERAADLRGELDSLDGDDTDRETDLRDELDETAAELAELLTACRRRAAEKKRAKARAAESAAAEKSAAARALCRRVNRERAEKTAYKLYLQAIYPRAVYKFTVTAAELAELAELAFWYSIKNKRKYTNMNVWNFYTESAAELLKARASEYIAELLSDEDFGAAAFNMPRDDIINAIIHRATQGVNAEISATLRASARGADAISAETAAALAAYDVKKATARRLKNNLTETEKKHRAASDDTERAELAAKVSDLREKITAAELEKIAARETLRAAKKHAETERRERRDREAARAFAPYSKIKNKDINTAPSRDDRESLLFNELLTACRDDIDLIITSKRARGVPVKDIAAEVKISRQAINKRLRGIKARALAVNISTAEHGDELAERAAELKKARRERDAAEHAAEVNYKATLDDSFIVNLTLASYEYGETETERAALADFDESCGRGRVLAALNTARAELAAKDAELDTARRRLRELKPDGVGVKMTSTFTERARALLAELDTERAALADRVGKLAKKLENIDRARAAFLKSI